eukprot:13933155-Heterocapsa_arctica.AAC.1
MHSKGSTKPTKQRDAIGVARKIKEGSAAARAQRRGGEESEGRAFGSRARRLATHQGKVPSLRIGRQAGS